MEYQIREYRKHRETLIRECRCEALIAGLEFEQFQRDKVVNECNRLVSEINRHRRRIGDANGTLADHKWMIYYNDMEARHRAAQQAIYESEKEIVQLQKQVDLLEIKLAEHDAEIARIEEQMICE